MNRNPVEEPVIEICELPAPETIAGSTVEELLKCKPFDGALVHVRLQWNSIFGCRRECWAKDAGRHRKFEVVGYGPGFLGYAEDLPPGVEKELVGDHCRKYVVKPSRIPGQEWPLEEERGGVVAVVTKPKGGPTIRNLLALVGLLLSATGLFALVAFALDRLRWV